VVEVKKKTGESNEGLVRRFIRKIQSSGKLIQVKKKQFRQPTLNKRKVRLQAIRREELKKEKELLRKTGKLDESPYSRNPKIKIKK
jgi:ribosomal protein S21